jgi:nucleoside-diphosphate-sugar epimerase
MNILVTGATGFVGKALCEALRRNGDRVSAASRRTDSSERRDGTIYFEVGDIDAFTDWKAALQDIDVVIHLAARVHVMRDTSNDPLNEFMKVNTAGTEHLARSAAANGVKRLVYVSSIKVNGEETVGDRRYTEQDAPRPQDPYGISKWEAEQALHQVAQETGLEIVIVRPPLVYGAGVKGNFIQMMGAVARGVPLPFASSLNKRDLLYVGNLVDALITCASHPASVGQTYLLCDGEPVSTAQLLRALAQALAVPSRLFPFPLGALKLAGKLSGRSDQFERLLGSLQIDSGKIRRELNWTPPFTMQQGLQTTADWYRNTRI